MSLTKGTVYFPTFPAGDNDGEVMLATQHIAQFSDAVIGLLTVVAFVMLKVVRRTENDVVMDMTFINMCGDNIRIFPL